MNQRNKTILFVGFLIATNLSLAMYDTNTGRFMQQDPLGTLYGDYHDGMSLYQYSMSNPIEYVDSTGLVSQDIKSPWADPMTFKVGTHWPHAPRWYRDHIKEADMLYGIDEHKLRGRGSGRHLDYVGDVVLRTSLCIAYGQKQGWNRGASHLNNYMSNTGATMTFPVKQLIIDVPRVKSVFERDMDTAMSFVEDNPQNLGFRFFSTNWINHKPFDTKFGGSVSGDKEIDWNLALRDYLVVARGKASCSGSSNYKMEFTYKMKDFYYWDEDTGGGPIYRGRYFLPHIDLRRMHRYGRMKMFVVLGLSYTVNVEWEKGGRNENGRAIYRSK